MGLMQRNKGKRFERQVAAELRAVITGERVLIHRSSQAERAYNPDVMMEGDDVPARARVLWLELCDERAPNPLKKLEQGERDVERLGQTRRRAVVVVSHRFRARHLDVTMTRHAGRGGVGAVMGSKNIKVIVLDVAGAKIREPKDLAKFQDANKRFVDGLKKHPVTGQGLPAYGTNVLTNILNEVGGYPTYNFKQGRFDGAAKISGETQAETETKRGGLATHGCHRGCVIQCSGTYHDKDGKYLTKQPEYETVWAHGGNCGISDLDKIAMMDFLDDNYGIDTIEMGATIAVAMEVEHCSR